MAGGHAWQEGICGRGVCMTGVCVAREMATAAGGTHPTGMHSCLNFIIGQLSRLRLSPYPRP